MGPGQGLHGVAPVPVAAAGPPQHEEQFAAVAAEIGRTEESLDRYSRPSKLEGDRSCLRAPLRGPSDEEGAVRDLFRLVGLIEHNTNRVADIEGAGLSVT